jgi:poly(A) polymerase
MDWLIEALRVVREVRDWTSKRSRTRTNEVAAPRMTEAEVVRADNWEVEPMGPAKPPSNGATIEKRSGPEISLDSIDPQALSVVRRLRRFGHKAYLVGGCVRDLLLGLKPKDFDIATDAKPEEIKSIFRNSRIIGRRFRLVHLYFRDGKIIEVSTFRAKVEPDPEGEENDDLLIRRDNVFGTEQEDARRRDFTINGLFYDVAAGRIIDHVGGMPDIRDRYLRMIGDPNIRLREDPVRILRAIRFKAKTGLRLDPELERCIRDHREDIQLCAPARVLEETLRLLRIGVAAPTVELMEQTGVLRVLLPEVQDYLDTDGVNGSVVDTLPSHGARSAPNGAFSAPGEPNGNASHRDLLYGHLRALDELVARGPVSDAVVLGALFYAPLADALDRAEEEEGQDRNKALVQFLAMVGSRISLTRRLSEHLRQLFMAQRHLGRAGTASKKRRRRVAPTSLLKRGFFPDALNLYEVRARALDIGLDEVHEWHQKAKSLGIDMGPLPANGEAAEAEEVEETARPKKKRRRRRRRAGSSPAGAASAET